MVRLYRSHKRRHPFEENYFEGQNNGGLVALIDATAVRQHQHADAKPWLWMTEQSCRDSC